MPDHASISDVGIIDFCCPKGEKVKLVPRPNEEVHEDGEDGEVFVRSYMNRKKVVRKNLESILHDYILVQLKKTNVR